MVDAVFTVGVLMMLTFCSELSVMTPSRSIMKSATVSFLLILLLNVSGCFSLQCHHTEYWSGTDCCPKCLPGKCVKTDCSLHRSTSCTGCEGGTFMNQTNGLQHCFPCRSCGTDSGLTVKTACTTTSNAVCEPVEGFYCVDVSQGSCAAAKQHSSCQPGQYISKKGSWHEDTECSACPDGTFSTGSSSSCQPHTQCLALNLLLIKAGSSSADAECGPQGSDHTGVIVGVTVSLIAVVVVAIAGGLVFLRSKKRKENVQPGSWHEDTECSACPDGTFSNGTFSWCQPHTRCLALNPVLIKAGSSSADTECGPGSDHTGVIVGVTVSLIAAVVAAIAGGLVFLRSKKRKENGQPDPERRPLPEGTDVLQLHCGEPEQLLQLKTAAPQSFIYKVLNGFQRRLKTFCSIKSRNKHDFFFQVHWCYTAIYRLEDCQKTSVTLKRLMSNIPSILKTS